MKCDATGGSLGITWIHRITNEAVKQKTRNMIGEYGPLLGVACRKKLTSFGHTTRRLGLLAPGVIHGLVEGARGEEGKRNIAHIHGRLAGDWYYNIRERS